MPSSADIDAKIALQKLIKSDGWKVYVSILSEYGTRYGDILMKVDPILSELRYNIKDMNCIFLQNIDLLTAIPELYINSATYESGEEISLDKMVQNDYDRIMSQANALIKQSL